MQQSGGSDVETSLLNGKIDREFGSVFREDQLRLKLREIGLLGTRNSDAATIYGMNSQLQSQQSELHHANQWACQAQMESRKMYE